MHRYSRPRSGLPHNQICYRKYKSSFFCGISPVKVGFIVLQKILYARCWNTIFVNYFTTLRILIPSFDIVCGCALNRFHHIFNEANQSTIIGQTIEWNNLSKEKMPPQEILRCHKLSHYFQQTLPRGRGGDTSSGHRDLKSISHKSFCNRLLTIQGIILGHSESKKDCLDFCRNRNFGHKM